MEPDPAGRVSGCRLVDTPALRPVVSDLVRRSLRIVEPGEADLVEDLIDPLVDRALRGEPIAPGPVDVPGGFGGAELVVWAVVPVVLHAMNRLLETLGERRVRELWTEGSPREPAAPPSTFSLSMDDVEVLVRVHGIREQRHRLPEIARAVHEAILESLAGSGPAGGSSYGSRRDVATRDFAIELRSDKRGNHWSRVLPSAGGGALSRFVTPFCQAKLPRILSDLECGLRGARNARPVDPSATTRTMREIGSDLFDALFRGGVRDALERGVATARGRRERLRLRLVLDPSSGPLRALPWEALFDRRSSHFLALDPATPLVRQLLVEEPFDPRPDPARLPLRLLIVTARPHDTGVLNVEHECDLLEEVLGRRQDIRVEICRDTTVSALRQAVRRFSPHVLHFIGHGTYPGASGKGAVLLLGPGEGSDRLAGAELSTLLLGSGDLRLVVLNACDTAALPRRQGVDPYSAVATALLRGRAPAVVAMQFPITDESAISFSGALYDALVDGDPIDLAVVEGRRAIFYRDRDVDTSEWVTPTLYLQLQSGDLFGLAGREVEP